jgi:hypothetical protein
MRALAWIVLGIHVAIIAFNVAGLVLIPLGAWWNWRWVRGFWWRLAHLLTLAAVAAQALAGKACFLTLWQSDLAGNGRPQPLIAGWIDKLIYWPLPLWFFAVVYVAVLLYVIFLWWRVPPRPCWRKHDHQ